MLILSRSSDGRDGEFGDGLVVTASFGDAVLVHLVSQAMPGRRHRAARHRLPVRRDRMVRRAPARASTASTCASSARCRGAVRRTCGRPTPTAAARRARSSRCSGRWPARRHGSPACAAPTRRAACHHADRPPRPAARRHQGQPHRHVDRRGRRALHGDGAAARAPVDVDGLPVDRLLAVHPSGRAGRGRPQPAAGPAPARPSAAFTVDARRRRSRSADGVEDVKRQSGFLRGTLAEELAGRRRRVRRTTAGAAQVPRHLPAGRPRRRAASGHRRSCRSTTRAWSARRCRAAS